MSWITGAGAVSCLGLNKRQLVSALLEGRSGIDQNGLGFIPDAAKSKIEAKYQTAANGKNLSWPLQMSLFAASEAMDEAGWTSLTDRDGLILATTTGQIPLWDHALSKFYQKEMSVEDFKRVFKHYPLGTIMDDFSVHVNGTGGVFRGPRTLITSACSAATQAVAIASMWLQTGKVERCLVGGVEVLCDLTVEGFRSMKLLSKEHCRPFDRDRGGINLSEGAAFFCLENKKLENKKAGDAIKVCGYGMSTDSHHMTAPHPEGDGSFFAVQQALKIAGLAPEKIDWFHAHGTGSVHNDSAESLAIHRSFGDKIPFVSSTKWYHGHALGASGLLEGVISLEGLRSGTMFATRGMENRDERIPFEIPQRHVENKNIKYVLKNTLGFGGANACFILGRDT